MLNKTLKRRFAILTPQKKKLTVIVLAVGGFIAATMLYANKTTGPKSLSDKVQVDVVTPVRRNVDVEDLNSQLAALQRQLADIRAQQKQADETNDKKLATMADQMGKDADIQKRIDEALAKKGVQQGSLPTPASQQAPGSLSAMPGALPTPGMPSNTPGLNNPLPSAQFGPLGGGRNNTVIVGEDDDEQKAAEQNAGSAADKSDAKDKPQKKAAGLEYWLPMGSIMSGVTLNGADMPTTQAARRDPMPMLVRVKKEAILPSNQRASVKECFVMLSGYGDMSSSRAMLRAERMSCILAGGKAVEVNISGYVVGEDGKPGLQGPMVSKEGEVIAKAMRVGVVGAAGVGVSGWLGNQMTAQSGNVSVSLGGGGGNQGQAAAAPIGRAFEKIADYYADLAKNIVPVVEINPLRNVDIVLVKGVSIPIQ
jgi:conjugal transfer pilus assembly protein TraB